MIERLRNGRIGLMGWALVAYVSIYMAYSLIGSGWVDGGQMVLDLAQMVAPLGAAGICWLASRRAGTKRLRWSWMLLSLCELCWLLAQLIWSYYETVLGIDVPTPSVADAFWLVFYPLAFAGLILQVPRHKGGSGRLSSTLDALILTLASAGLIWQFTVAPALTGKTDSSLIVVTIAYPLGDLFLIGALVSLVLRWPLERVPFSALFLLGGFVAEVAADLAYTFLVVEGIYQTGSVIDPIWSLGSALIAFAALSYLRTERGAAESEEEKATINLGWTQGLRITLPYLALPALAVMTLREYSEGGLAIDGDTWDILLLNSLIVGLIIGRQFLTVRENYKLNKSLALLTEELEERVAQRTEELSSKAEELAQRSEELTQRTAELTVLNKVATSLSHCVTPEDVLSTGLALACEATGTETGVVWVAGSDGLVALAESRGLGEDTWAWAAGLPERSEELQLSTMPEQPIVLSTAAIGEPPPNIPPHLLVVPLLSRRHMVGLMGLMGDGGASCCEAKAQVVQGIGSQVGVALENARRYEEAKYLADRDPVTGLLNHRAIHQRMEQELKRSQRGGQQLSIVMMDMDEFKLFNDTYGHPVGDQVLRNVASLLVRTARASDIIARYGGDEFVAILPETDTDSAVIMAERLRSVLAEHPYTALDGTAVPLHMSFGVATYPRDSRNSNELVGFADTNLYHSKHHGGDVITSGDSQISDGSAKNGTFGVLDGLVTAVDNKDHYTRQHSEGVTEYALAIAGALGLSEESCRTLRIAGLLHDVGKIGVPDSILRKPGKLDDQERGVVQQHAQLGEMIIKEVPNIADVLAAVGSHHERFDGHGYPRGLQDGEIPLLGRILAVADAYSAMTTDRPYRKRLSEEDAEAELRRVAGSQLDPELVNLFLNQVRPPALRRVG